MLLKDDREKGVSLEELKDEYLGKEGSYERDNYEFELTLEIIQEKIKTLRQEKHLTQAQLGEKIGVKKAQISRLESDANNITLSTAIKLFNALGKDVRIRFEDKKYPKAHLGSV
ncbi:Antitoxin HipB [compost metagenome]